MNSQNLRDEYLCGMENLWSWVNRNILRANTRIRFLSGEYTDSPLQYELHHVNDDVKGGVEEVEWVGV